MLQTENMKLTIVKLEADICSTNNFFDVLRKKMMDHEERFNIEVKNRKSK